MFIMALCVLWTMCFMPAALSVNADDEEQIEVLSDGVFVYSKTESADGFAVEGIADGISGEIEIPESYLDMEVVQIGKAAFMGNTDITAVKIPATVQTIESEAFRDCTNLADIIISDGVCNIGSYSFAGAGVKSVTVPETVESIKKYAFLNCMELSDITLSYGLEYIGSGAFSGCTSLKSASIPETVTEIGSNAFNNCTSLEAVSIGEGLEILPDYIFQDCTALSSVVIKGNLLKIGSGAFSKCISLQCITIPDTVVEIKSEAFQSCRNLEDINIPEGICDIGINAFFDTLFYNNLRAMNPETDFVIYENRVLLGCYKDGTDIEVPSGVEVIGGGAFLYGDVIETIQLPETIRSLSSHVFYNLFSLRKISNFSNVSYIGEHAFCDCAELTEIFIPESVDVIREGTFLGCTSLQKVEINNGTEVIKQGAFAECTALQTVVLPESITCVETNAFDGNLLYMKVNNAECIFEENSVSANTLIAGYIGSTAYDYAAENGNSFEGMLSMTPTETTTTTAAAYTSDELNTTATTVTTVTATTTATPAYTSDELNTTATTVTTATATTTTTTAAYTSNTTSTTITGYNEPGDLDGDGRISLNDVSIALTVYAYGVANLPVDELLYVMADVNHDNVVNKDDAMLLIEYYAEFTACVTAESFDDWRIARQ